MSQIKEVNSQIVTAINKTSKEYEALWGKDPFTPRGTINEPNDYNCGAICNQLEYLYQWIQEISNEDINSLENPYIDIMIYFFTGLQRRDSEETTELIERAKSYLVRESDWRSEKWGTPWDLKNILSYYLPRETLYYIHNSVMTNVLINGDFEDPIGSEWTFFPSGDRSTGDSFVGAHKVDMNAVTSLSQTISLTAGTYILNWFAKCVTVDGFMAVSIQRSSDAYYWDIDTLSWVSGLTDRSYALVDCGRYVNYDQLFTITGSEDITISFKRVGTDDYLLDRVNLGIKEYPFFEILYVEVGGGEGFAAMWENETNPENASYLDQDFMLFASGLKYPESFYDNIVKTFASAGVLGQFKKESKV